MRLIDADALRERLETTFVLASDDATGGAERALVIVVKLRVDRTLDAAPSIDCAAAADPCESCEWYQPGTDQGPCTTDDPREWPDNCPHAAPSINCTAHNPHGLVPSKCPTCGEGLVPAPCMDLAQDSYRDGIRYGQEHPEWRADG